MTDNPLVIIVLFAVAVYVFKMWLDDYKKQRFGEPIANALPGAFPASRFIILMGAIGAILLTVIETIGESALGVSDQQTDIAVIFLLAMVAAGFIEELIFRGFLFVDKKGPAVLWGSIVFFSVVFALLHFHFYLDWEDDAAWHEFTLQLDTKAQWTLFILFANSMWFYFLRFCSLNPRRSLLPCIIAHVVSNLAVFFIKLAQGHVTSLW